MNDFRSYRKDSRIDWGTSADDLNLEQIRTGALLRIADACEKMCMDREKLERDYAYMRGNRDYWSKEAIRLQRSNSSLRGVITKLKKAQP